MRNKARWKIRAFTFAMTAVLSVMGITSATAVTAWATPASGTAVSDNIVVRESAVSGAQVGGLSEGQAVSIEDETTGSDGNTWYQITYTLDGSERSGWVRGDLLETSDESLDTDSDADVTDSEDEGSVSLEFETRSGSITLTDIPEDELLQVSNRFVETSLTFEEAVITALQLAEPDELVADDAAIVDFYYVYGYNEIGETGWYVYNADDGTIQKNLLNMQYSMAETTEEETEAVSDFSTDSLVKMAVSVLAVIGLLLLILTIIFSVRYRRLRRILEEELEEEEELPRKKGSERQKRKNEPEERERAKTGQKAERSASEKAKQKAERSATEKTRQTAEQADDTKAGRRQEKSAKTDYADGEDKADNRYREKVSPAKKNKKRNASVQEEPAPDPMSEIGGVDVMDLDSMDDLDFEALLNRYLEEDLEEDLASEKDTAATEPAAGQNDSSVRDAVKQKAEPVRDAVKQKAEPVSDVLKQKTGTVRETPTERQEKPVNDLLDDYDIPLEKGDDYDILSLDESDIIDLSKLKMPDDEPKYYDDDDDDDLEFL